MADPIRGKLVWQGTGDKRVRRVVYPTKNGMSIPTPFDPDQLAASLRNKGEDEIEVDLEVMSGKPVRIRPVGESFAAVHPQPPASGQRREEQGGRRPQGERRPQPQGQRQPVDQGPEPAFHNPYNFVPAPPRKVNHPELGDRKPVGHHRYHADRVSGVIRVTMTVKTPLLLPDAGAAINGKDDHKTFPDRLDADGKPLVAPTGIKGMLRSAYEAVTNSRMAVFAEHGERLADRMPARDGLALVPARIVASNGSEAIELLPGNSEISGSGRPADNDPMYAAWLPRYHQQTGEVAPFAVRYPGGQLPEHRDEVEVWLELWERTGQHPFAYWLVRRCVRASQSLGPAPAPGTGRGRHQPITGVGMRQVRGFVCVTNRNIDRKHDERVFFTTRLAPVFHQLTDDLRNQWRELITNYQAIHEAEIASGMTSPPALNNSVWSRQVDGGVGVRALTPGTLCYAAFHEGTVTALYPVMISRRLHEASPAALLPNSSRPATGSKELSPADRVFGWVSQSGQGAYRGNVRVGPVTCTSDDAVERFTGDGLPLAILGQPKEQQARFYVAASPQGEAQAKGITKEQASYRQGKGLRGRKVYPHHAGLPDGHWRDPVTDRTQQADNGHHQEYRRPRLDDQEQRDNQNRSIQGWVKVGTNFSFDLHVTNLSRVELGALLWLLKLPPDHFHRLGGGKPIGLGSVRLGINEMHTDLRDGEGWKQFYSTLDTVTPPRIDQTAAVKEFEATVEAAYGAGTAFDRVPFIAAFLKMVTGFNDGLPTHYPRAQHPPHPEGRAYEWFVENDRTGAHGGPRVCLRDLATDPGLPMLPK
ncbi:MAG: TIGR03986 family CRISPR-associated RAMP protein [Gemmataceae bacterium]